MDNATGKKALRLFTYGLYLVTGAAGNELSVMTANWIGQVSFEPRMISVAVEQDSHSAAVIRKGGVFAIGVLESGQRELAAQLSRTTAKVGNKLGEHRYTTGTTGAPLLIEALAWVECRTVQELPTGDHVLFLGEVVDARVNREGQPLTLQEAGFKYSG